MDYYHMKPQEIRKLIGIRQAHEALQSNAPIRFLYAEENQYPLVYLRAGKEETIVVALNPSGKEVSCRIEAPDARKVLYSHHGEASLQGGTLKMPAASASFLLV